MRPDHFEEECAVFGVFAPGEDVSRLTYFGLHALQHRGQESAGIAVGDGDVVTVAKDLGLVTQVFRESDLATLTGHVAIGHTRYSTCGSSDAWDAAQPHLSWIGDETIAVAHNGALVNAPELRKTLLNQGVRFRSTTDSEVAAKLIGKFTEETHTLREGIRKAMALMQGAYAMTIITPKALYAFRDPNGIRPLVLGELSDGRGWVLASETCGLDIVGAAYVRDIDPGEIVKVSEAGVESMEGLPAGKKALCVFEHVYFARPDSVVDGAGMYESRVAMGERLAAEAPTEADLVIGVPDSGVPAAVGYARASGIPYGEGLIKNRYVGRTFIQPTQALRQMGIRLKLNPLRKTIEGKRLVVCDDSIVRGNTSKQIVQMLRDAGAVEVHLRIVSPEVLWPCFYGIDTDDQAQLIAANMSIEQITEFVGADSLAFLSLEGLIGSIPSHGRGFCSACFDGEYPVDIPEYTSRGRFVLDLPGR